jgi:outer membrane receptor protein involved in Fe transport
MSPVRTSIRSCLAECSRTLLSTAKRSLTLLAVGYVALGAVTVASAQETATSGAATTPQSQALTEALQEVTVTARRRTETLQQIPYNIQALSSDALAQSGVTSINGMAQLVPGLQVVNSGPNPIGGNNQFSMRGLNTNGTGGQLDSFRNGTVAPVSTYFGETPIFFPIALQDLQRVEVLKGPQGTLYGSGSVAGTIRFIPNAPSVDRFYAEVNMEGGHAANASNLNGSLDAVLNAPLASNLAFRLASGFQTLGGFIDNVNLAQRSIPGDQTSPPVLRVPTDPLSAYAFAPVQNSTNWSQQWYVRPALLWKISDATDAELLYSHERVGVGNTQIVNPDYPGGPFLLASTSPSPNSVNIYQPGGRYRDTQDITTPSQSDLDLASLVITAHLGFGSLTSSTSVYRTQYHALQGYVDTNFYYNPDGSLALDLYDSLLNGFPRGNTQLDTSQRDRSLVQEIRLVSTWDKPIDYIVGAYFQTEHFNFQSTTREPGYTQYLETVGTGLPRPAGDVLYTYPESENGYKFEDLAIFGQLTWHITPKWQVTGGARVFHQDFTSSGYILDTYLPGPAVVDVNVENHNALTSHILMFDSSYDFTPNFKLYATYSQGFRRGGANAIPTDGLYASLPELVDYQPDKSVNYEVGVKGQTSDRRLRYTADVYLINLQHFQFDGYTGSQFPAVFNGSEARSKGVELESEYEVTRKLTVGLSYAYTDAYVAQGFTINDLAPATLVTNPNNPQFIPVVSVATGGRLPGTSKNAANAMVDYTIPLESAALRLHADVAYRSSAPAYIDPTSQFYWVIPATTVVNARITYDAGQRWAAYLFGENLTNETVYSGASGVLLNQPNLFTARYVGRPRTYGLGLHYRW